MTIGLVDAQRRIVAACVSLGTESVPLEAAFQRVLATDLHAEEDLVPFARSAMDGFAVRACDTREAPVMLPVRGAIYAEAGVPGFMHAPLTATAVATGAPLPPGADAVIPVEDAVVSADGVRIARGILPGAHIFPPGEDARRGDLLAPARAPLAAGTLGLLAAAGYAHVSVVRRPRVAIVCSGEELVRVDETPAYGQIRNSNATLVAATMTSLGADVVSSVQTGDDAESLRAALVRAFAAADLVVTTGGASVGERDLVKPLLRELGVRFEFESVALRPARPTAFGRRGAALVAVLAGNPAAAFVALHELVRPAVYRLAGRTAHLLLPRVDARAGGSLRGKSNRTYLAFVRVRIGRDGFIAMPLGNQCSALTRTASDANGFAVLEPESGNIGPGDPVAVDIYDWARIDQPELERAAAGLRDNDAAASPFATIG
jgi:molybdopterin molybdotransferase